MKLRDFLKGEDRKFMLVDSNGGLAFCGCKDDPGSFRAVAPFLDRMVVSTSSSGTYALIQLS